MKLRVEAKAVGGDWVRHSPQDSSRETANAEWYRSIAEWGLHPEDFLPFDLHRWKIKLDLADLSDAGRLAAVGLDTPRPSRRDWPAFQNVGERLWREGWAGLVSPSAARPDSLIACVFTDDWPPAGCRPLDATGVLELPPLPGGISS